MKKNNNSASTKEEGGGALEMSQTRRERSCRLVVPLYRPCTSTYWNDTRRQYFIRTVGGGGKNVSLLLLPDAFSSSSVPLLLGGRVKVGRWDPHTHPPRNVKP